MHKHTIISAPRPKPALRSGVPVLLRWVLGMFARAHIPGLHSRVAFPVIGVLVFLGTYGIAVLSPLGRTWEDDALNAAATPGISGPLLLLLVTVRNLVFTTGVLLLIALIRQQSDAGLRALFVIVVTNPLTQLLKFVLLHRPTVVGDMREINTFPSGHTTAYLAFLFGALMVLPATIRSRVALCGAVACSVAIIEMLALGWHRPSDIIGAAALVITVATLSITLVPPRETLIRAVDEQRSQQPVLGFLAAAAFAVGVALLVVSVTFLPEAGSIKLLASQAIAVSAVLGATFAFTTFLDHTAPQFLFAPVHPRRHRQRRLVRSR